MGVVSWRQTPKPASSTWQFVPAGGHLTIGVPKTLFVEGGCVPDH